MTEPDYAIAVDSAAPHWTVFRPTLRVCEEPLAESLSHPSIVNMKPEINVNQRISDGKSLPDGGSPTETVDDPLVTVTQLFVSL